MYEEDFVNEEAVEFDVDGKKFKYKPTTAGEENGWLNEYMYFDDEEKKSRQDFTKLNECKMRNLVSVPYDKETINKILNMSKEWHELDHKQKWVLLGKLKPGVFDEIVKAMNRIDRPDDTKKKDSSRV